MTYTNLPQYLSYTNTSKLTWIKPLLKTIQSVLPYTLIRSPPLKQKENSRLFDSRNHLLQINSYLFAKIWFIIPV